MLKNNHQKKPYQEKNLDSKFVLTDEHVVLYIQAFFKVSPRLNNGTAPANEWLQFLELYNQREGHYILTDQQMDTIRPYCEINADVEMTPEDFIRLIHLIRHGKMQPQEEEEEEEEEITPQMSVSTKQLFDSRPRSSKMLSRNSHYYEGRKSPNHPSTDDDFSSSSRKSAYSNDEFNDNHNNIYTEFDSGNLVDTLKRDKLHATKQIRDYESRILSLSNENSSRITQLQTRLEYMSIEAEQQKALVLQQKNKERERLDKISELQAIIADSDLKISTTLKKQQKKDQQMETLKDSLIHTEELYQLTKKKFDDKEIEICQEQEVIRALEKDKVKLQTQLEEEKRLADELKKELQEQQKENKKLLETIDKQRVKLVKARSESRSNTASPALDENGKSVNNNNSESSLAQEQVKAEYLKKITLLETEKKEFEIKIVLLEKEKIENQKKIMEYEERMDQDCETSDENIAAQEEQQIRLNSLSTDFDLQQRMMYYMEAVILYKDRSLKRKMITIVTAFAWLFLFYHLLLLGINIAYFGQAEKLRIDPLFGLLGRLDDWYSF